MRKAPLAEKFWAKVAMIPFHECWEWTGARFRRGYGHLNTIGRAEKQAHRISWELNFGPIPNAMWVLHRCDNPSCVRPDHLFLGTRSDNMLDCLAKGRHNFMRGRNPRWNNRKASQ